MLKWLKLVGLNNYLNIEKMIVVGNRPTQDHFSKVSIYNFSGLKKYKKGYIEMTKKFTLRLLRSVLGWSISHYLKQIVIIKAN